MVNFSSPVWPLTADLRSSPQRGIFKDLLAMEGNGIGQRGRMDLDDDLVVRGGDACRSVGLRLGGDCDGYESENKGERVRGAQGLLLGCGGMCAAARNKHTRRGSSPGTAVSERGKSLNCLSVRRIAFSAQRDCIWCRPDCISWQTDCIWCQRDCIWCQTHCIRCQPDCVWLSGTAPAVTGIARMEERWELSSGGDAGCWRGR